MLSSIEVKVLDCVYSMVRCYSSLIPLGWKNGKLLLRPTTRRSQLSQNIMTCLVASELIMRIMEIMSLSKERAINEIILQSVFLMRLCALLVLRLNIRIFSTQLVQLINECFHLDYKWG